MQFVTGQRLTCAEMLKRNKIPYGFWRVVGGILAIIYIFAENKLGSVSSKHCEQNIPNRR